MSRKSRMMLPSLAVLSAAIATACLALLPAAAQAPKTPAIKTPGPAPALKTALPANLPRILNGITVFHAGTKSSLPRLNVNAVNAKSVPGSEIRTRAKAAAQPAPSNTIVLTPSNPVVSSSATAEILTFYSVAELDAANNLALFQPVGLPGSLVALQLAGATVGQYYLIDLSLGLALGGPPAAQCQVAVSGPDGNSPTFPCPSPAADGTEHILFGYAADQSGNAIFNVTVNGVGAWEFFSAAIAPVSQ